MVNSALHKVYKFSGNSMGLFKLFKDEPFCFFLDSSLTGKSMGRFSFIGFDPFEVFESKDKNALKGLRKRFEKYSRIFKKIAGTYPVPLPSGIVGYFGYDLGFQLEKIERTIPDDLSIPDCFFGFYDTMIAIDHVSAKLHIISTGLPETDRYLRERKAQYRLEKVMHKLSQYPKDPFEDLAQTESGNGLSLISNFTKESYQDKVAQALKYISQGDIYQVNLAQRFMMDINSTDTGDCVNLYQTLRNASPACFGAYLDCGNFKILSASPERFLKLNNNVVSTRPMKGTRPRGANAAQDRKLQFELMHSKKEKAELLMITDLERNDLGRVCRYGSVSVKSLRALEKYKTVFQTTATVEGILKKDKDCFDAIEASFPGGSVTGCPKIRAMEVIEELESVRRSFYTGSLGYISFSGEMDFNVLIRSLLLKDKKLYFYVGSGIVADSNPADEYEETLIKSKALRDTVTKTDFSKIRV